MNACIEMELMVAAALRGMQPTLGVPVLEGRAKTTRPPTYITVNAVEEEYLINQLLKVTVEILHVSQVDDSTTETARAALKRIYGYFSDDNSVLSAIREAGTPQMSSWPHFVYFTKGEHKKKDRSQGESITMVFGVENQDV
jgi:hypothetical protein